MLIIVVLIKHFAVYSIMFGHTPVLHKMNVLPLIIVKRTKKWLLTHQREYQKSQNKLVGT